jgi:hypothetical protein
MQFDTWNGGVPDNTLALNLATGGFLPDSIWINQLSNFLKSSLDAKKMILLIYQLIFFLNERVAYSKSSTWLLLLVGAAAIIIPI